MPILEAYNLCKTFRAKDKTVEAVKNISLRIDEGELLAFLGPNGAGKTTTIKMIAGLIWPDCGSISVVGKDPQRDASAMREIGAVLEGNRNVYWRLTPVENLEYFGALRGVNRTTARQRADVLLERFGLTEKRRTIVQNLSRGMQQKLAIAMALMHEPKLLLLDEPTLGLDVEAAESVKILLREIVHEQRGILLTTHQLNVAQELSDRVTIIRQGEIVAEAPTEELIRRFSGQVYTIEVGTTLSREQQMALEDLGATVENEQITYHGKPEGLWQVLEYVKPLPLVRVVQDHADLTEIFLKLIRGESHA